MFEPMAHPPAHPHCGTRREIDASGDFPANHATYYPGAETMTLGSFSSAAPDASWAGRPLTRRRDKRIDVLAVAIRVGMTAADLTESTRLPHVPPKTRRASWIDGPMT
ncbi:MAG: hypothetical protein ACLVKA_08110 [Collinsella aerofaciens]